MYFAFASCDQCVAYHQRREVQVMRRRLPQASRPSHKKSGHTNWRHTVSLHHTTLTPLSPQKQREGGREQKTACGLFVFKVIAWSTVFPTKPSCVASLACDQLRSQHTMTSGGYITSIQFRQRIPHGMFQSILVEHFSRSSFWRRSLEVLRTSSPILFAHIYNRCRGIFRISCCSSACCMR